MVKEGDICIRLNGNRAEDNQPVGKDRELEESFERVLSEDILAAIARRERDDSQTNRRDVVRTSFAGIEGLA